MALSCLHTKKNARKWTSLSILKYFLSITQNTDSWKPLPPPSWGWSGSCLPSTLASAAVSVVLLWFVLSSILIAGCGFHSMYAEWDMKNPLHCCSTLALCSTPLVIRSYTNIIGMNGIKQSIFVHLSYESAYIWICIWEEHVGTWTWELQLWGIIGVRLCSVIDCIDMGFTT